LSPMRTKVYLETNRNDIYYYDFVKKAVDDLYPLRLDRIKTLEYFNNYLYADCRYAALEENSNGEFKDSDFKEIPGEVNRYIAYKVRIELLNVISGDDTFIFAHNIITFGENKHFDSHRLNICKPKLECLDVVSKIENLISEYKEDYPKSNLSDYLMLKDNWEFYCDYNSELQKDEEWWLEAFNNAYALFDKIRVKSYVPFSAQYIIKNIYFNDKEFEAIIVAIIKNLIDNYNCSNDDELWKRLKILSVMIEEYNSENYLKIDKYYQNKIFTQNLDKVNWLKATKFFNYNIIRKWVFHESLILDQKLNIINLIEKKYYKEKENHPDILIYDLSEYFQNLRDEVNSNLINECDEINSYNESSFMKEIEALKIDLFQKIIEIEKLYRENEALKDENQKLSNDNSDDGMTVSQLAITFYYIFNELGVNFGNSDKTEWAKLINKITGKSKERIRRALNIEFETKISQKNLRYIANSLHELFPLIEDKIKKDIKE
jgi:hypothetical protein